MVFNWKIKWQDMVFQRGVDIVAEKGSLGITEEDELVFLGDTDEVIERAPLSQTEIDFCEITGDKAKLNGNEYQLSFYAPPMRYGLIAVTNATGEEYPITNAIKIGKKNRDEFKAFVEKRNHQ